LLLIIKIIKEVSTYPSFETKYYIQTVDHFDYQNRDTFLQRYLINDDFWGDSSSYSSKNCRGPIFFYTGNESPVTDYWYASGFFVENLAMKYGALLIFAEHRYFGESMPYGSHSFDKDRIGFCAASQALADYAVLLTYLKTQYNASSCPIFAFGGSYGGMLTTWFRIKYPHLVMGGLAASAPFAFYGSGVSPYAFSEAASFTYENALSGCGSIIKKGYSLLYDLSTTQSGRDKLSTTFKLCYRLLNQSIAQDFINWVDAALQSQPMLDYPYPTNYGINIGAWPVNDTCKKLKSKSDNVLAGLADGIGVWYNYTGDKSCYDIKRDAPDWGKCCGWDYLACTEVYLPSGTNGIFPHRAFNLTRDIENCYNMFGVILNPSWPQIYWGGFDALSQTSHIIFSNGLLDPWHTSGVLSNISDTLIAIVIPEAAHHLDLRSPNKADPIYVAEAREKEDFIIGTWLKEYFP